MFIVNIGIYCLSLYIVFSQSTIVHMNLMAYFYKYFVYFFPRLACAVSFKLKLLQYFKRREENPLCICGFCYSPHAFFTPLYYFVTVGFFVIKHFTDARISRLWLTHLQTHLHMISPTRLITVKWVTVNVRKFRTFVFKDCKLALSFEKGCQKLRYV